MKTRQYTMSVTIKSEDGEVKIFDFPDVWFSTDDEGYGNRTYLRVDNYKYYDIRYDTSYSSNQEIAYLSQWASNYWSGENGAWKLVGIKIERKD